MVTAALVVVTLGTVRHYPEPTLAAAEAEGKHAIDAVTDVDAPQGQPLPDLTNGIYKIAQRSTARFLDAHQTQDKDFAAVTRPDQDNRTQQWRLTWKGHRIYTLEQVSSTRFLDAHETPDRDFAVVTRPPQPNSSQRWIFTRVAPQIFTIEQESTRQRLDAYTALAHDFAAVTRPRQFNRSQQWIVRPAAVTITLPLH
jgi:hypothetical protein